MSTPRTTQVTVGDIDMTYDEVGSDPVPLVLVHGFTGARTDFAFVQAPLAGDGRRVIAVDQRGHRDTSNPADPATYTFEQLVTDLDRFLDEVVDGPVHLLGHSMGGMVAMRFALAHPDRLASLVLMDTSAEAPELPFDMSDEVIDGLFAMVRDEGLDVARRFMNGQENPERALMVAANGASWAERDEEERYAKLDPNVVIELGPRTFRHDPVLADLATLAMPTTIIVGAEDTAFVGPSERMSDVIDGAELVVIDGAYHSPQHTHREQWLAAMSAHLERA